MPPLPSPTIAAAACRPLKQVQLGYHKKEGLMAVKNRRAETNPNRAESVAEMIARMAPSTADAMETEVWSRLGEQDGKDFPPSKYPIVSGLLDWLEPCDFMEVESMIRSQLDDQGREEMQAVRLRAVSDCIARMLTRMPRREVEDVKKLISARLKEQELDEMEMGRMFGGGSR